jgi:CelD/BcsL family acetyltransferase involved in cellulose biosynthesis
MAASPHDDLRGICDRSRVGRDSSCVASGEESEARRVTLTVQRGQGALAIRPALWNELARRSQADHVFLQAEWLQAANDAFGGELRVVEVWSDSALVGAAAFVCDGAKWSFLGRGSADYQDLLIARDIPEALARDVAGRILDAAFEDGASHVILTGVPVDGVTPVRLQSAGHHVTEFRTVAAPTMDMTAAEGAVRKKSLRRHTNKLRKAGDLEFVTSTSADTIDPRLYGFFEQHVARWADTPTPSLFNDPRNREFYHSLVGRLAPCGSVRLLEVVLDGRVVAAHLGFVHGGRYTWYKPTFDPAFSEYSPGEVLLRRLIEDATDEAVDEFDFTVGDEPFKLRFATRVRTIVDLRVDKTPAGARRFRTYLRFRDALKGVVGEGVAWNRFRDATQALVGKREA